MSGGTAVPVVFRTAGLRRLVAGRPHGADRPMVLFVQVPGLKVFFSRLLRKGRAGSPLVGRSTRQFLSSLDAGRCIRSKGDVPERCDSFSLGRARIQSSVDDVTSESRRSGSCNESLKAVGGAAQVLYLGLGSCDPRTLQPLDEDVSSVGQETNPPSSPRCCGPDWARLRCRGRPPVPSVRLARRPIEVWGDVLARCRSPPVMEAFCRPALPRATCGGDQAHRWGRRKRRCDRGHPRSLGSRSMIPGTSCLAQFRGRSRWA